MKIIGILGGVASGKSLVAEELRRLGVAVLDADAAGHAVLLEPEVENSARHRWGSAIFGQDGHIDRPRLASIVFAPGSKAAEELSFLEQISHPRIAQRLRAEIDRLKDEGLHAVAVLDAAVLMKAGWDQFCDVLVYVDAPRDLRLARAKTRSWSEEEFTRRELAQESLPEKQARCDVTIDNSTDLGHTRRQLMKFWNSLYPPNVPD